MPDYLEKFLGDRIANQTPERYTLHCPFHGEDAKPSCSADNTSGTWLFNCFACGASGSVIDMHAQLTGMEPMSRANLDSLSKALNIKIVSGKKGSGKPRAKTTSPNIKVSEKVRQDLEEYLRPYHDKLGMWRIELNQLSPVNFVLPEQFQPHSLLKGLYLPDQILWMGSVYDTGKEIHTQNFKPRDEWLALEHLPPRIAGGTFKPRSISRSKHSVLTTPYVILESDTLVGYKPVTPMDKELNRCLSYGLIRYAQDELGLNLRAVIDTSNKSLHAWFDRPDDDDMLALHCIADGLHLDTSVLGRGQSSPLRAPGCVNEETTLPAQLMYLNPKY